MTTQFGGFITEFVLARYNANGNLDLTFGEGGFRLFDLNLGAELAKNVAVQSNGAIILSGPHTKDGETVREQHTAVVRLDSRGDPIAENVAIAPDGKIVLSGLARDSVDGYGLARVNP